MSLGKKLFLGFLIPVLMLTVSGSWSYLRFRTLSHSLQTILHENDRSIQAAREMSIALERMDSATLMILIGDSRGADVVLEAADNALQEAFVIAKGNITLDSEPAILDSIQQAIANYRGSINQLGSSNTLDEYREKVLPKFLASQHTVNRLRRVNQEEMYENAVYMADQAYRATLPGSVLVVAAILFTVLFAWLLHEHMVKPLRRLVHAVKQWPTIGHFRKPELSTGDELEALAEGLEMVDRFSKPRE